MPLVGWTATDDAASVIVNIQQSADKVASQVLQDLTTRIAELSKNWQANMQKTLALHAQAKQDGHATQVAQFENQLSRTMQQAGQELTKLLEQREPTREALVQLDKVLVEGSRFFAERERQAQADSTQLTQNLNTIDSRMRELAQKHRQAILTGQVSPQLDVLVRGLETERRTLELRTQIQKRILEVAAHQRERLHQYQVHVTWLQGLSHIAFTQAQGQIQTLGDLAQLRHLGISYTKTVDELIKVARASAEFSNMVQQTQALVDRMAHLALPADLGQSAQLAVADLPPTKSVEILKRYLEDGRQVHKR
jgi:hypothetical protein